MSKIISTNKLNRLWVNGIKPTVDKVKNTVKNRTDLMSNSEENKLVDALAIKEAIEHHNMYRGGLVCGSLDEFLQATSNRVDKDGLCIPTVGRLKDTTAWGPNKVSGLWYRFMIVYQNSYDNSSSPNNINGNGIFWTDNQMWNVVIVGTKETGYTFKYELVNKPTITTKPDLMANTVSGLFPDALAVKDAINTYNVSKYTGKNYNTLEEFVEDTAKDINIPSIGRFKDVGGFVNEHEGWYRYIVIYQNPYQTGNAYGVGGNGLFMDDNAQIWNIRITGNKDTGLNIDYEYLTERRTQESIDGSDTPITITLNDVAKNAGLVPSDFTILNATVVHYGTLNHRISIGLTCSKLIPANSIVDITFSNVKFQKNLSDWGSHPVYGAYASIYGSDDNIRCYYAKDINASFKFYPVISYGSNHAIRTVKI